MLLCYFDVSAVVKTQLEVLLRVGDFTSTVVSIPKSDQLPFG